MSLYVAAYDVSDNRQRERVARVLDDYGHRIQRSVFEVWLDPPDVPELRRRIGELLARTDAFDLFPVDDRGNRVRCRWQHQPTNYSAVVII